jgi:hypothetical protein
MMNFPSAKDGLVFWTQQDKDHAMAYQRLATNKKTIN